MKVEAAAAAMVGRAAIRQVIECIFIKIVYANAMYVCWLNKFTSGCDIGRCCSDVWALDAPRLMVMRFFFFFGSGGYESDHVNFRIHHHQHPGGQLVFIIHSLRMQASIYVCMQLPEWFIICS